VAYLVGFFFLSTATFSGSPLAFQV